jgi:hypothetical protein
MTQYINQGVPQIWCIGEDVTTSICGTTNDCILRFDTVVANGTGIANGTTAANGTDVQITRSGVYHCSLTYIPLAGGTLNNIGISLNTDAAGLVGDPGMATTGIGDFGHTLSPAATDTVAKCTYIALITRALAAATAHIRFHAGDGANATPAAGDLVQAECRFQVHLIGHLA